MLRFILDWLIFRVVSWSVVSFLYGPSSKMVKDRQVMYIQVIKDGTKGKEPSLMFSSIIDL